MAQQKRFHSNCLILIVLTFLLICNQVILGCFITNCPPAGKRSMMPGSFGGHRECTRCGPNLSGRCYGPNICCSPLLGCNIGGFASSRCSLEAYHPTLCSNPGPSCGPDGKGLCALNATCCTNDGCFMDKSCMMINNNNNNNNNNQPINNEMNLIEGLI